MHVALSGLSKPNASKPVADATGCNLSSLSGLEERSFKKSASEAASLVLLVGSSFTAARVDDACGDSIPRIPDWINVQIVIPHNSYHRSFHGMSDNQVSSLAEVSRKTIRVPSMRRGANLRIASGVCLFGW